VRAADLRSAAVIGLIAGAVVLYLTAVGIVLAFAERNTVTGVLTLGRLMLAIPPLAAGFVAAKRGELPIQLVGGLIAGASSGVVIAVAFLFASAVNVRDVLVRVSASLLEFVAFGQEPVVGAVLNLALATVLGLIGAGLRVAPPFVRRPIIAGALVVVVFSMLEPFLRPRLTEFNLTFVSRFLYEARGVSVPAAIVLFLAGAAATLFWRPVRAAWRRRLSQAKPETREGVRWASLSALVLLLLVLPQLSGPLLSQVLVLVGLYVLLGLGLNIVVGYAGLLDLGYVAFYAVGSYLTALLTSPASSLGLGLPFWVALPIVVVGSAIVGLLIGAPVLRLRGDYLAIVTLGFGEIARILFLSDALKPWLGGVQGIPAVGQIFGVSTITVPFLGWDLRGPTLTYYPLLLFCIVAAIVAYRLKYSRTGRAWNAMREDEDVAEATGVNTVNYKLLAFAMGAAVGCLGGAVFSTHLQSVFPGSFNILVSITVLAIVILGGMGSIPGVVVGSLALIGLPELLREFAEFRLLVYGGVLVLMMLLRPEGLLPDYVRRRELHEEGAEPMGGAAALGAPVGGGGGGQ
jgi:branched-chain amino acid transport system permease protein